MNIFVNEEPCLWSGKNYCGAVRDFYKSDADIIICNGAPVPPEYSVSENDHIVLIKRGEIPSKSEVSALLWSCIGFVDSSF